MRELFRKLHEVLEAGEDAVLVSTVSSRGSVPRGSGAHMLVTKDGRISGTIGGGEAEYMAEQAALSALGTGENAAKIYDLRQNSEDGPDSVCGGDMEVFFRFMHGGNPELIGLCERIEKAFLGNSICRLVLELTGKEDGLIDVYSDGEDISGRNIPADVTDVKATVPKVIETDGARFYTEPLVMPGKVYIFGGGHVAQRLVPCLSACDFRCVVIEDRADFADPKLFGGLAETRLVPIDELAGLAPELTHDDYVCVMTRGHRSDYECIFSMLKSKACYIGVIGSRSKIAALKVRLSEDGVTEEEMQRLVAPIGIEIYSETPAEIAVSVTAQLIMTRAVKNGSRKAAKH